MLKWITFIRKTNHTDCRFCFKPSLYLFQERIQHERKHIASNTNREIGQNPLLHFFNVPKMIDQKNEQIMPQVHPQCIFANAAYNPCECIAILNKKKKPPYFVLYCRAALHSGPGVRDRLSMRISTAAKRPPQPASSSMASRVLSAENRNAPVLLYTSTCPPTCLMMQSIR